MRTFPRPAIVASKCLEFEACRYDGQVIACPVVRSLKAFADITPVCPEVEIGLGVPRETVRIITAKNKLSLHQPATGRDLTGEMTGWVNDYLAKIGEVDGFILKSRSPSCGIRNVKIYPGTGNIPATGKGAGFFAGPVLDGFPHLAAADDESLENASVCEHFLTRLFALADFRQVRKSGELRKLAAFQSRHELLLMAHSQKELRNLARIAANENHLPWNALCADYAAHLSAALARMPRSAAIVNVLMHTLDHFNNVLSAAEKEFFLYELTRFRRGIISLHTIIDVIRSWIPKLGSEYLSAQTFFEPYPEALSGLGRHRE